MMMKWNWLLLSTLVFSTLSNADDCGLSQQAQPLYLLQNKIVTKKLENGLLVKLLNRPDKKTVSIVSQFEVGSKNEVKGQTGYAHLFEHLLFEGSKNAPADTFDQQMDAVGANTNASTWFDRTNYFESLPSYALELALFLDSDRFQFPDLTPKTIAIQKQAVLQERTQTFESQPYLEQASDFLLQKIKDTPYGHNVLGSRKDIKSATEAELRAFQQQYYRPDNMQLSIVGGLTDNTFELVAHYFADWKKPTSTLTPQPHVDIPLKEIVGEVVDDRGPWPASLLFWQTVGRNNPDKAAIQLLQAHLFSDKAGRLRVNNLNDPDYLLYFPLMQSLSEFGVTGLAIAPRARTPINELADSITDLVNDVKRQGISQTRLCYLKSVYLNHRIEALQSNLAIAKLLSDTPTADQAKPITADWERVEHVSVSDIQRVAKTYFTPQHSIRLDLLPPWYIRWAKRVLEWLPKDTADSAEEAAL